MKSYIQKLFGLLTKRERRQVFLLIPALIFMALLEVVGIASVMPFLTVLANPDSIETNVFLKYLFTALAFTDKNSFLLFLGVATIIFIIVSNGAGALVTWRMFRFVHLRNYTISKRLLESYLNKPYIFYLNRNTAVLTKNVLAEVNHIINSGLLPTMQIFEKCFVAIFILVILISANPLLSLVSALVAGIAYLFIYGFVKKRLHVLGEVRTKANSARYKVSAEAFGGIKITKFLNREKFFSEQYSESGREFALSTTSFQIISQLPRFALESIAFGGIILIVLYFLSNNLTIDKLLPLLGLYAFSAYRLLPALQNIFKGVADVKFTIPALEALYEDFDLEKNHGESPHQAAPLPFKDKFELANISFSYPNSVNCVLSEINLAIKRNESVGIVGLTGSGKTTLIDIILGLLRPSHGEMKVDGRVIDQNNLISWQRNLGYVPQDVFLTDDTVAKNIAYAMPENQIDMRAVQRAAQIANIHEFIVNELPEKYNTLVGERGIRLSGGQKQRIGIARALYQDPDILLLDEATSALDGVTEENIFHTLNEIARTKTLIIIAHRITTLLDCDMIYVLNGGEIISQGSFDVLMNTCPQFRALAKAKSADKNGRLQEYSKVYDKLTAHQKVEL